MTEKEQKELEELRAYKLAHEGKSINRAFMRLNQLLEMAHLDPSMSIRAFRVMAECLICLKDELNGKG